MKDGSNILRILPALCADPAYPVSDLLKELDCIRIKAHTKFLTRQNKKGSLCRQEKPYFL